MSDNMKIGAGLALDGEKEFKQAISGINKDLSVLGSEMKKVTSEFGSNANSMDALRSKSAVYNKQIDDQKSKVSTLADALENAKKEYGENSDKVKEWQIKLNNAEAQLNNTENALKDTTEQMKKLDKEKLEKFKGGLKNAAQAAAKVAAAVAAAGVASAAGIAKMTVSAAQSADEINTLAKQTGLSTEEIQKFQYASEMIDVPLETLTKSMAKNIKSMAGVQMGTKEVTEAYKSLGVEVLNSDGSLRDGQTVYNEVINALGNMENETQRDALAMQILGKSAQDLNPLILGGADALKKLGDEAEAAGVILEQDALDNLNSLSDSMDTFKATLSGSGSLFSTAFAAPMAGGIDLVTGYLKELTGAFDEGGFDGLASKAGEVLTKIITQITEGLPKVIELGMSLISTLADGIIQNLPLIVETALEIIVQMANGIAQSLPELVPTIVETVLMIVNTLIENVDLLVDASLAIIIALAEGIINSLPALLTQVPTIIVKIVGALIENLPKISKAAREIIISLGKGIIAYLGELFEPVGGIVSTIIESIRGKIQEFKDIGKNIIKGVWEGISNMATWIGEKVSGFFDGVLGGVKKFLGINSPSKVFAGIGENMALGLGVGFEDSMNSVAKNINKSIPTPTMNYNVESQNTGTLGALSNILTGNSSENINLTIQIDGQTLARQTFEHFRREGKLRGTPLIVGV